MAAKKKTEEVKQEAPKVESTSPKVIALSIQRKGGDWILVTYTFQDNKLISTAEGVPNSKAIILHQFKIAAADTFWTDK